MDRAGRGGPAGAAAAGIGSKPLSPAGIGFALAAGMCWALYIVFGRRAGAVHGGRTAALGTLVGALVIVPIGIAHAGRALFSPALLPLGGAVALLSSALPYSLEMYALPRLPTRTFGVLMSLSPHWVRCRACVFSPSGSARFNGRRSPASCWLRAAARRAAGRRRCPIDGRPALRAAASGRCARTGSSSVQPMNITARYRTAAPNKVMAVVRNFGCAW